MANYYDVLRPAVESIAEFDGRRAVYNRARAALVERMRAALPPIPESVIEIEQEALEQAIQRVEADLNNRRGAPPPPPEPIETPDEGIMLPQRPVPRWLIGVAAVLVAAIVAVLTTVFLRGGPNSMDRSAGSSGIEIDDRRPAAAQTAGANNPRAYVFGRQLIYYRSTHPTGTIIIDKGQRFLYLVRSNVSATRYGIGVGKECLELPPLMKVSRKALSAPASTEEAEWMGQRLMFLENDARLIHGTTRPDTIGHLVRLGCVRLTNEDVIELYNQTPVGGRVVVTN